MNPGAHLQDEELLDTLADAHVEHLRVCARCRDRRTSQERVRDAVKQLDREAPPPASATALLERASHRRPRRWHALSLVAALVAAVVFAGWSARRSKTPLPAPVIDELALDHLHYEHKTDAAEVRGDTATIAAWFSAKLGFAPHVGALEATSVDGARPCRIAGKWTALMWLDRAGHRLSLFTMPEQLSDRRGCASAQGVHVCAAPDPRGGARVLVGDLPEGEMLRLVDESLQ